MKKLLLLLIACILSFSLIACGGDKDSDTDTSTNIESDTDASVDDPSLLDFEGITFTDKTVNYNGKEQEIIVSGTLPQGATVNYTSNKATNAGEYNAEAVISCEGYNTLTLNAKLTINKIDIEGITFTGATVSYDANEHKLEVAGTLPDGVSVSYTGGENKNASTNSGEYEIIATLTGANYNTLELKASLVIKKLTIVENSISFSGETFEYDAKEHSISVTGNIPYGVSVSYSGGENGKNGSTSAGTYTIVATISGRNYNTLTLEAELKIKSTEEMLNVHFYNGNVYFQNALDKNKLYAYDGSTLTNINRDTPTNMVTVGSDMFYISQNLLANSISMIDATGKVTDLFDVSAEMIATDGTYIYYNVNSLLKAENTGIYKVKVSDLKSDSTEVTPIKLTSAKSEYIVYAEGYIYFSNKSEGSKLYAISTSANNANPTLIYDYKVTDIITDGEKLYFTRTHNLTSAIYSIDVDGGLSLAVSDESNRVQKITMSKGKYLTKIGDYIYFMNTDMLTSTIFGDGIYKAPADGSGWVGDATALLTGSTKVIDAEKDNVYALTTDGDSLYYFRASTKHLYKYDLDNDEEIDLMEGFIPPEEKVIITTYYEKSVMYNGEIYFINMRDGGKLYKYNPQADAEYRLTGVQVADFAINEGYLYYCSVKLLVNFDLYRMSLLNGEPERISTEKCMNMSFYGDKMYYTNYSGSNTLNSMNLDGTNDTIIYGDKDKDEEKVGAAKTIVYDGYVYFEADNCLYRYNIQNGTAELVNKDIDPIDYLIYNGKILVVNEKGTNHIDLYDIATDTITKVTDLKGDYIVQSDDARGLFVFDGEFYFYRNIAVGSSKKGLYKVVNGEAVLVDTIEGYYACETIVDGDKAYFLNVWQVKDSVPTTSSDGYLYELDLNTNEVTKLN